jgi:hypothetical protein
MTGSQMTLARYYAKQAVKAQWRSRGLKPEHAGNELAQATNAYLDQHLAELIAKACAALEIFAQRAKH